MITFPILLVTPAWDFNFYRQFSSRTYWKKNKSWVLVERLTLHPPVIVIAACMLVIGAQSYILASNLLFILAAAILLYTPFFLVDERWTKRYNWPQAPTVIFLVGASSLGMALAQAILWGVPLW
jgi:hypothetical protein